MIIFPKTKKKILNNERFLRDIDCLGCFGFVQRTRPVVGISPECVVSLRSSRGSCVHVKIFNRQYVETTELHVGIDCVFSLSL